MVHGYVPLQVQELYESSLVRLANLIAPTMIQELGMRVVTWPAQAPLGLVSSCVLKSPEQILVRKDLPLYLVLYASF